MTTFASRLGSVPPEVLEHIAFCAATQNTTGPPSGLLPLLLTCRDIYRALSLEDNALFYARIFSFQFDMRSAFRRLGSHALAPWVLASELKKRWAHLKRIRARVDSRIRHTESCPADLIDQLWLAYLMMLENDGRNERQLLEYAEMDVWLMEYWFDDRGASLAVDTVLRHAWPAEDTQNAIAMWLFWFLLRPEVITRHTAKPRGPMLSIVKAIALAANHYPVCHPSWTRFLPRSEAMMSPSSVTHFSETHWLHPPTLGPAAILVFLNIALRVLLPRENYTTGYSFRSPASLSLDTKQSEDWDADWYRCLGASQSDRHQVSEAYKLGSLEGVWEGVFVYTEFNFYWLLLSGGAPSVLDGCLTAHHRQTWKLREYHFVEDEGSDRETSGPLGPGDPLEAHFTSGTRFRETADAVQVWEPGKNATHYWRPSHSILHGRKVVDVIILGEGHSAWGQFNMRGRVRPLDGMVSFCKEYAENDRGRWLYRGYLVGNVDGYISGRWRDTLSPVDAEGYEGCFVMGRRR